MNELLINGVMKTKAMGSSTYVMALLNEDQKVLKTLNLGDSGFIIL